MLKQRVIISFEPLAIALPSTFEKLSPWQVFAAFFLSQMLFYRAAPSAQGGGGRLKMKIFDHLRGVLKVQKRHRTTKVTFSNDFVHSTSSIRSHRFVKKL